MFKSFFYGNNSSRFYYSLYGSSCNYIFFGLILAHCFYLVFGLPKVGRDDMTWMEKAKEGKNEKQKRELHELPYTEMIKSVDNSCHKEEAFFTFSG